MILIKYRGANGLMCLGLSEGICGIWGGCPVWCVPPEVGQLSIRPSIFARFLEPKAPDYPSPPLTLPQMARKLFA